MALMTLSNSRLSADTMPLIQERSFAVRLRCVHCDRERSQVICLADEPNDPGTEQDFYESGGVKEIDPDCIYCGETGSAIVTVTYLRQPGDVSPNING